MSNVLTKAKTLLTYDIADLDSKLAACEAPAMELFEHNINDEDFAIYYAAVSGGNISSYEAGSDDYSTLCYCPDLSDVQYLKEGSKIIIAGDNYAGTYKIFNLNITTKSFEIQHMHIFLITETGTFTNARKNQLEYAAAYFLLYQLISQAQEIRNGKVLFSSTNWSEGSSTQASIAEKQQLAQDYKNRAYQYLNYQNCTVV